MQPPERIRVRVVYALAHRQTGVELTLAAGATVGDAVSQSGLIERFSELAAQQTLDCAVFGRVAPLSQRLVEGDRVEILRPLLADPKESRRQAAARSRAGSSKV